MLCWWIGDESGYRLDEERYQIVRMARPRINVVRIENIERLLILERVSEWREFKDVLNLLAQPNSLYSMADRLKKTVYIGEMS